MVIVWYRVSTIAKKKIAKKYFTILESPTVKKSALSHKKIYGVVFLDDDSTGDDLVSSVFTEL